MDSHHHPHVTVHHPGCNDRCDPDTGTHYVPGEPPGPDDVGTDVSGWTPIGATEDGAGVFVGTPDADPTQLELGHPTRAHLQTIPDTFAELFPWQYDMLRARYRELPQRTGWEPHDSTPSPVIPVDDVQQRIAVAVEALALATGVSVEEARATIEAAVTSFREAGHRVRTTVQGYRVSHQLADELGAFHHPDELHRVAAKYLPEQL